MSLTERFRRRFARAPEPVRAVVAASPDADERVLAWGELAGGATLIDDGISCDHDGILDPGESGRLRVTVANTGLFAADDVNVTATTTAGTKFPCAAARACAADEASVAR